MDAYLCSRLLIASADFSSFTASSLSSLCTLSSETWYFLYLCLWKPVNSLLQLMTIKHVQIETMIYERYTEISCQARLAQSVEHGTLNPRVVGSSPTLGVFFDIPPKLIHINNVTYCSLCTKIYCSSSPCVWWVQIIWIAIWVNHYLSRVVKNRHCKKLWQTYPYLKLIWGLSHYSPPSLVVR